jgi:hypothetical protein
MEGPAMKDTTKRLEAEWELFSKNTDAVALDDLVTDEIAPLFKSLAELIRLGVRFDPDFVARMDAMHKELVAMDPDGEMDGCDEAFIDDGFGSRVPTVDMGTAFKLTISEDG